MKEADGQWMGSVVQSQGPGEDMFIACLLYTQERHFNVGHQMIISIAYTVDTQGFPPGFINICIYRMCALCALSLSPFLFCVMMLPSFSTAAAHFEESPPEP